MAITRLTDLGIKALMKAPRTGEEEIPDGTVQGLFLRISPTGAATWTQVYRVLGEGGTNRHGKPLLGKRHRVTVGQTVGEAIVAGRYPECSIESARAEASANLALAKRGVNPKDKLRAAATAGTLTIEALSKVYLDECVRSRELDSLALYENGFEIHINPQVGSVLAELATREDARKVMNEARKKRPNPSGRRGSTIGGIEAARTAIRVLRSMFSWAITEKKLKRQDNPCSTMANNLPKAKRGEVVLSVAEARIVYQAARECGYPFGTYTQQLLLSAHRKAEWAEAEKSEVDLKEALFVVSADKYKSDHVHVMPLVPKP
jgi:Arm DNA-binding domain